MRVARITAVLLLAGAVAAHGQQPRGGWIGWAYLGEGGDLPLRIWFEGRADGLAARFDGVPWGQRGWKAEVSMDGQDLALSSATPEGTPINLSGTVEAGRWSGTAEIAGYSGDFELLHAPGLADVDPASYSSLAGYYRMSDGDILEAKPRPWGEIVIRSIATGQQRTLMPTGPETFMTGSARYVPTPVEDRYRIVDAEDGAFTLVRESSDGSVSRGSRFGLLHEDLRLEDEAGATLAATITRPDDRPPSAGIVLLGGAVWAERATVDFWTRNLAALGFAVVAWDRRGFGESGGGAPSSFETTATDGLLAASGLRKRGIAPVGYLGISRGGWTAPIAVSRDVEAAFLILLVPPAASPAVQEHTSRLAQLRADGFGSETVDLSGRMLEAAWRFAASGDPADWASYQPLREAAGAAGVPDELLPPPRPDRELWQWSRLNMAFDPRPSLRTLQVPMLAIFGEFDLNVLPGLHRPLLADALVDAPDVTLVTLPGVAHNLARPSDVRPHRSRGVGAEGFDVIIDWARARGLIE